MKLIKILQSAIQIKSDDEDFVNCHINDLIKISDGEVDLVTMILSLQCREEEVPIEDDIALESYNIPQTKTIECAIIGSIVNGKFTSSVDRYPSTDVTAEMISSKEFSKMLQPKKTDCFRIGTYAGYDTPAYVNGNSINVTPALSGTLAVENPKRSRSLLKKPPRIPGQTSLSLIFTVNTAVYLIRIISRLARTSLSRYGS